MNKNTSKIRNAEEKNIPPTIFQNLSDPENAKKFLEDLLFDAENCEHLEPTVDGLMLLFEVLANKDTPSNFLEELQTYLYSWTPERTKDFTAYFESVKAGKDYRRQSSLDI